MLNYNSQFVYEAQNVSSKPLIELLSWFEMAEEKPPLRRGSDGAD